jgi:ABC-type transporter Mla subunit MlaD
MASQLEQLKSSLNAFAQSTERTGQSLASQGKDFQKSSQQISALIGGSATSKDREVMAAVAEAQKAVQQASNALAKAARTAKDYASGI